MPHNRFYLDAPLEPGSTVILEGEEWRHLALAHRARPGDALELVNGRNHLAQATVLSLQKNSAEIAIQSIQTHPSPKELILAQAIPRMNHLEWIIEKGTELNATAFWLFPGEWSEKETLSETQLSRLRHLSIAAMKQCGRLDLPSLEIKPPLRKWAPLPGTLLYGDTSDAPYLWDVKLASPSPLIFFVGPEKGFSPNEVSQLKSLQAQGVRLHSNILRAETAPLAALALLQPYQLNFDVSLPIKT